MKVLVSAASKHGSTTGIAEAISKSLTEQGVSNDVIAPKDVTSIDGYDALVLGSGVYAGHWLSTATDFVKRFHTQFPGRLVWLFSSGPLGEPLKPDDEHAIDASNIVSSTGAIEHRIFAGKLDREDLGYGEKALAIAFRATEGDFRDWPAVEAWVQHIVESLRP